MPASLVKKKARYFSSSEDDSSLSTSDASYISGDVSSSDYASEDFQSADMSSPESESDSSSQSETVLPVRKRYSRLCAPGEIEETAEHLGKSKPKKRKRRSLPTLLKKARLDIDRFPSIPENPSGAVRCEPVVLPRPHPPRRKSNKSKATSNVDHFI